MHDGVVLAAGLVGATGGSQVAKLASKRVLGLEGANKFIAVARIKAACNGWPWVVAAVDDDGRMPAIPPWPPAIRASTTGTSSASTISHSSRPTDRGILGTLKHSSPKARNRQTNAGWAREVTVRNFPISKNMAGVNMRLRAGAVRELHWHVPSEWAYVTYGSGGITVVDPESRKFAADVNAGDLWFFPSGTLHSIQGLGPDGMEGRANTLEFFPSDVGYVPFSMGHYIENIGNDKLTFLEIFSTVAYSDVSLKSWLANTPGESVSAHLNIDQQVFNDMNETKTPVVPA